MEEAMRFIQLIEFTTTRFDDVQELMEDWLHETQGKRTALRACTCADRDRPNTYVQIVEFNSHEEAMVNSSLPATDTFARRFAELCDEKPAFRDLDVRRDDDLSS